MKKYFKLILSIIISLVILNIFFHLFILPKTVIRGRNLRYTTAIQSIDRGNWILPAGIENITFKLVGKNNPRGILYFMGEVSETDFKKWCDLNKIECKKITFPVSLDTTIRAQLVCVIEHPFFT